MIMALRMRNTHKMTSSMSINSSILSTHVGPSHMVRDGTSIGLSFFHLQRGNKNIKNIFHLLNQGLPSKYHVNTVVITPMIGGFFVVGYLPSSQYRPDAKVN